MITLHINAGFKTLHYTAELGDMNTEEDKKCLCLDYEGCMPKNVFNVGPCIGVPLKISHPHLYKSDPRYLEMVDGLNPDPVSFYTKFVKLVYRFLHYLKLSIKIYPSEYSYFDIYIF